MKASDVIVEALERELEEICREHYRLVYRTAYGVLGNHEDAEDVAQTIFLRLLVRDFPPDLKSNPKAYLYRAAVNESLNVIRSRRSSRRAATSNLSKRRKLTGSPNPPKRSTGASMKLSPS